MKQVIKRNGNLEPLNLDKFHKMIEWACEGISNVSQSEIEINSSIQFADKISTKDIHKITIKSAADLISPRTPNYQVVAGRLLLMEIRKEVFGQFEPKPLIETVRKNIKLGYYEDLFNYFTDDEINYFDSKINHNKDYEFTYAGLRTMLDSYTIKDDGKYLESPQQIMMLVSMTLFKDEKDLILRNQLINEYYNDLCTFKISLPSPFMSGLRTPVKGYASCCLIDAGDSRNSLTSANAASIVMSTIRAGIGLYDGDIRGIGAWIKNKTMKHTGKVQILQWFEKAVRAFSQPNRGGAATTYSACWNWEVETTINLKSNKNTEENSVKKLDYGIGFTNLFFERVAKNESWTLFSAEETRDLFEDLSDDEIWNARYEAYEKRTDIRKKSINARQLLQDYAIQYYETGRIYPLFLSNANKGPLKTTVKMSNLCAEILLTVKPLKHLYDPEGEIALCILTNVNAGKLSLKDDLLEQLLPIAERVVRALDNVIEIQEYPLPAAENSTRNARYLGCGVSDWAHYLTKHKTRYNTQEGNDLAEEFMEKWQFSLLTASNNLAEERGECNWFRERSKYADGWLPNDGKQRFIPIEKWNELRTKIIDKGLRHLVLSAIPPAATSSDLSNSTSGIDLPRDFVNTKSGKSGPVTQVVPNFSKGSGYYTLAEEVDNIAYIRHLSHFQKYTDQSISSNVYWSKKDLDENDRFPIKKLIRCIIEANKLGMKTLYYSNFLEDNKEDSVGCEGGGCSV